MNIQRANKQASKLLAFHEELDAATTAKQVKDILYRIECYTKKEEFELWPFYLSAGQLQADARDKIIKLT